MANLRAAKKSIRQDKPKHLRNLSAKSELKTLIKKLDNLISENKSDEAAKSLSLIMSKLDKASKKNILKKKTVDRKKSNLAKKVNKSNKS
ncbi:MAG: 30S ribosomal protein S20 [Candidatus Omnitrophota bacterium]